MHAQYRFTYAALAEHRTHDNKQNPLLFVIYLIVTKLRAHSFLVASHYLLFNGYYLLHYIRGPAVYVASCAMHINTFNACMCAHTHTHVIWDSWLGFAALGDRTWRPTWWPSLRSLVCTYMDHWLRRRRRQALTIALARTVRQREAAGLWTIEHSDGVLSPAADACKSDITHTYVGVYAQTYTHALYEQLAMPSHAMTVRMCTDMRPNKSRNNQPRTRLARAPEPNQLRSQQSYRTI